MTETQKATELLDTIIDQLDIPVFYYRKAADRHRSIGEWLCRSESRLACFQPHVSPQGSFRYGTVIRPLSIKAEYDLDNVTTFVIAKTTITQKQLKHLYGDELRAYANAHNMLNPVEEMNRCWRMRYEDEVEFHLDSLPSLVEEPTVIAAIVGRGVPFHIAERAVAITDNRHPLYEQITNMWPSSNPRGFARWFEQKARTIALPRMRQLVEQRFYAAIEDVPPYEWKTPLQRSIQILKRHRDVMFEQTPDLAPISMILTTLSSHAYSGEADIFAATSNILDKMPRYINQSYPRIPNPADPVEDYADKWKKKPELEKNFWLWHSKAKADFSKLTINLDEQKLQFSIRNMFRVDLSRRQLERFSDRSSSPIAKSVVSAVAISNPPRPWSDNDTNRV